MCEKKFPFLELRSVFKDNDVHHVQSLEKRLEDLDSLSLNFWLTKFVLEVANKTKLISKHMCLDTLMLVFEYLMTRI